jgi:hypothetical protein
MSGHKKHKTGGINYRQLHSMLLEYRDALSGSDSEEGLTERVDPLLSDIQSRLSDQWQVWMRN